MTQNSNIHLHSFLLIFNKRKKFSKDRVTFSRKESSFNVFGPGNPIEISGKIRGMIADNVVRAKIKAQQHMLFYTGDSAEVENKVQEHTCLDCCASSAQIYINFLLQEVTIYSSIVGLPPIFYCDLADKLIVTSDIYLLGEISNFSLYFDIDSVMEITSIGYPIDNKTLFQNVKMLPAGHILSVGKDSGIKLSRQWALPRYKVLPKWSDFLELQSSAFEKALQRIDLTDSFLSLTAGMDTRAIFAALTSNNIKIPVFTMTGSTLSLDARTARKLCKAYHFDHNIIFLNNDFYAQLPSFCSEACRLSGGLASLAQAHEVFFYSQVDKSIKARLSGNLGNQVGRGGAENISLRNAGFMAFNKAICNKNNNFDLAHWYAPYLKSGGHLSYDFLMEQEIPFSSVGNYTVGNYYATQQSPYADKQLIEISNTRPATPKCEREKSILRMRMKDLRHRFLSESAGISFQMKLIKETGGKVAEIPINWGGKATGGVSIWGVVLGIKALADAVLASKSIDSGPMYKAASLLRITGFHEYRSYNKWLKGPMKDFTLDLFSSKSTKECGLFEISKLEKNAKLYFSNKLDIYKNMSLSLDLALASKIFNARLR